MTTPHWQQLPDVPAPVYTPRHIGSWRYPHFETQKLLFSELRVLTHDSDAQLKHNAMITLAICGLTRLTGARTIELVRAQPHHFDYAKQLYVVGGKRNWAHSDARLLPLVMPAFVQQATKMSRLGDTVEPVPAFALWWNGSLQRALPQMIDRTLSIAGARRGLAAEEIPASYSFRHAFRSDGLAHGIHYAYLNTLMGHSGDGREPFSPYEAEFQFATMIDHVRPIIAAMAHDIGLEDL